MKLVTVLLLCVLASCGQNRNVQSTYEITGTQAERVFEVSRLISKFTSLPTSLLDANFVEEKTGDGRLGPSDFKAFYALKIAPADLAAWRSAMPAIEAQNTPAAFSTPRALRPWWLTQSEFRGLTFYSAAALTGRINGWVGVAPDGRIFVYTVTM